MRVVLSGGFFDLGHVQQVHRGIKMCVELWN